MSDSTLSMNPLIETIKMLEGKNQELRARIEKNCNTIDDLKGFLEENNATPPQGKEPVHAADVNPQSSMSEDSNQQSTAVQGRFEGMTTRDLALAILSESPRRALHIEEIARRAAAENFEVKTATLRAMMSTKKEFKSFGNSMWGLANFTKGKSNTTNVGDHEVEATPINEVLLSRREAEPLQMFKCMELILQRAPRPLNTLEIIDQMDKAGHPISGSTVTQQRSNVWTTLTRPRYSRIFHSPSKGFWTAYNSTPNQVGELDFGGNDKNDEQEVVSVNEE